MTQNCCKRLSQAIIEQFEQHHRIEQIGIETITVSRTSRYRTEHAIEQNTVSNRSLYRTDQSIEQIMALTRGAFLNFEYNRMVVLFSMINDYSEVPCAISTGAMDELERGTRTKPEQREEQFMRLRDRIEACAMRKFENSEFEGKPPGIVVRSIDFR